MQTDTPAAPAASLPEGPQPQAPVECTPGPAKFHAKSTPSKRYTRRKDVVNARTKAVDGSGVKVRLRVCRVCARARSFPPLLCCVVMVVLHTAGRADDHTDHRQLRKRRTTGAAFPCRQFGSGHWRAHSGGAQTRAHTGHRTADCDTTTARCDRRCGRHGPPPLADLSLCPVTDCRRDRERPAANTCSRSFVCVPVDAHCHWQLRQYLR